ncbi:hypothetical protein IWW47_003058 [Coemansia sp. RSA 2052]|nr:hypothetical protein IWW47_003058 [Coemansia sp. RSA 2052]
MVKILELAVVYRSRIVERIGWLEKQPVSAPIPRVSTPIARMPSSAVAPISVHRTPLSIPAAPVSAPAAPVSVHGTPVSAPIVRVLSPAVASVSAPAASVSAPAAPVSAPAAPITPERVLEEDNSMELDTPEPAVSGHPAPMDVEHPAPSSDLDEPAETCSDSVVPSVNGDSQFDEPPGAHGVRMALGKLLSIHGHLLAASNGGAELNPSVILSIEDILEKTRIAVTDSLLEQCKASPNLRGMLPLLLFLDRMKTAPCSTPTERSTRSVAIGKCLQQLLLWVKTNIRDVTAVAPTLGGYRVAIELADIDGAPTASASVVGSAKPSPATAATTSVVSPDTPHPHPLSSKLTAPAVAPRPVHVASTQKVAAPDTPASTVIGARTPQASPSVPPVQIQPTQQPMRAHSHSHAMPTINYSLGQNALGLVSVTSPPPSLPSFGYSHSAGHLHTTGSHIAFTPATSATQQRPAPVSSQSYGPWSRQPAPSSLASALASEYVNATGAAAAIASSSSQSPSSSSVSSQAVSNHQTLHTPQQLQWAQMESEQREQQQKQERLQQEQFEREKQQRLQSERLQQQQQQQQQYRPQRMTLQQQQQQQQQQLVQQFYELQRMYPHLSPQQIQAFMVQQQQIQQQIQQVQQNVRFLQHAAGGGGGQQPQPQPQQLVTPISGNYEALVMSQQQQQQQPPSSAGSYGRQMPAASAPSTWQANASSGYGLQSAAGAVSPPVYVESLNGFAATCDMTCVICEDPLHTPSSCPYVKDVGRLAQRRVSIDNCAKLPPNMKEVMLTTIDKYLRQALG